MTDYDICMGIGDYPSPHSYDLTYKNQSKEDIEKERIEKATQGLVQDSTGSWWDPTNPIDQYFMDW